MNDVIKMAAVALGVYFLVQYFQQPQQAAPYYTPFVYGWPYWQRSFVTFPFGFNFGRPVPPDIDVDTDREAMGAFGGGHMGGSGNIVGAISAGSGGAMGGGGGHH